MKDICNVWGLGSNMKRQPKSPEELERKKLHMVSKNPGLLGFSSLLSFPL